MSVTWPHFISAAQLTPGIMDLIFETTDEMIATLREVGGRLNFWPMELSLEGRHVIVFMQEPSTRTGLSFCAAVHNLGGRLTYVPDASESSSLAKGESVEDTYRMHRQNHPAAIVVRTSNVNEPLIAAELLSQYSGTNPDLSRYSVYVNAGSGPREHPTQACLDAYTINETFGSLGGLTALIAGDLGNARTINSLLIMMERTFPGLKLLIAAPTIYGTVYGPPQFVLDRLNAGKVNYEVVGIKTHDDIVDLCKKVLVGYWTRLQVERYDGMDLPPDFGEQMTRIIRLEPWMLDFGMKAFHPLPHRDEVNPEVMYHKNAMFEKQASRGVPVRMALLYLMLRRPELLVGGDLIG